MVVSTNAKLFSILLSLIRHVSSDNRGIKIRVNHALEKD